MSRFHTVALLAFLLLFGPARAPAAAAADGVVEQPSASFGLLGTVVPDSNGQAHLLADKVQVSAGGDSVPLSLGLLADGGHVVTVVDAATLAPVACGAIPRAPTGQGPAAVTVPFDAEGKDDSGVRATAVLAVQSGAPQKTLLTLEAEGLQPDARYVVHLHAGTREQPSASSGFLGELQADAAGRGRLQTWEMAVSASGALVDLSLDLADGNHFLDLHDPDGNVVASGELPPASPTGSGGGDAPSGIEPVDAVISAPGAHEQE
ncbi:MAG: hypothetical protein HY690_15755 [Chloroflexi bacterium]|nr:hypothetical protein [Chloroflexota bacterium]